MTNPNTNCLENTQCPYCQQHERFIVRVESGTELTDNGTDFYANCLEYNNVEWHAGSSCECPECGFTGKMFQFRKGTLLNVITEACAISIDGLFIRHFDLNADALTEIEHAETTEELKKAKEAIVLSMETTTSDYKRLDWGLSAIQLQLAEYDKITGLWSVFNVEYDSAACAWVNKEKLHTLELFKLSRI